MTKSILTAMVITIYNWSCNKNNFVTSFTLSLDFWFASWIFFLWKTIVWV